MPGQREQAIRERAYAIWEEEGRPDGKGINHWLCAEGKIISAGEQVRKETAEVAAMSQSYLLDTNAFFSLSRNVLEQLHMRGYGLYVSPYVFWERLCHLDKRENFEAAKGEFKKFGVVEVLDDPLAAIEKSLLPTDAEIHRRVLDADLIYAALAALRSSKSLGAFYYARIQDSNNCIHQVEGCVDRARKTLREEVEKYVVFVKKICLEVSSRRASLASDQEHHQAILGLIEGRVRWMEKRGASDAELRTKVIHATYIYYAYIFQRALKIGKNLPPNNDYEDGRICLHLKRDTSYCLVTDDRKMRDALKETASLLSRFNDPQFQTTLVTCDTDQLR
jgi:hypothetical protein